jgi:LPXTG-motif cell wall-anchored protein
VPVRSLSRRVLGLGAVGVLAASSAVLSTAGTAHAAPAPFAGTVTAGTTPADTAITVPVGYCALRWELVGGQGGAAGDNPGRRGGRIEGTTAVAAGDQFLLQPGQGGGGAGGQPLGGHSGSQPSGEAGDTTRGGGGGASVVRRGTSPGGERFAVVFGGAGADAAGADASGGAGGDGNLIAEPLWLPTHPHSMGVAATDGDGHISYTGVACTAPQAPFLYDVVPGTAPGSLQITFNPPVSSPVDGRAAITGYEVSLDGGSSWRALTPTSTGSPHQAVVTGLAPAVYQVALRATSAVGPSEQSSYVTRSLQRRLGIPTGITATVGATSMRIAWQAPADATGITGYRVRASAVVDWDHLERLPEVGIVDCEVGAGERSCLVGVEPGWAYSVSVYAVGEPGTYLEAGSTTALTTEVVPEPRPAPVVPESSGQLVPKSPLDDVTVGERIEVSGSGYLPNSTVVLVVYSTPQVLGTVVTDGTGAFTTTVQLPAGLPAGSHTLVASGVDPDGNPRDLTSPVTVTVSSTGAPGTSDAGPAGGATGTGGAGASATSTTPAATSPSGLASTGADVALPVVAGLVALIAGAGLVVAGRRRAAG